MNSWLGPNPDDSVSLDVLVSRISSRPQVDGILLMGSTGSERFDPGSDHDVCVVLNETPPIRMVVTWVKGHLTEIYLTTTDVLKRITGPAVAPYDSDASEVASWFRQGHITFDRSGILGEAQEITRAREPLTPGPARSYDWWFSIGYNLAQTKRRLAGSDTSRRVSAEVAMMSNLRDIARAYFAVRRMSWPGNSEAVRFWSSSDPPFLRSYLDCLRETDIDRKLRLYEELARIVLEPVGPPWPVNSTMIGFGPPYGSEDWPKARIPVEQALKFWQGLTT